MILDKCNNSNNCKIRILMTVFIVIYFSNDTLLFGTNANKSFFRLHIVVLGLLTLYWSMVSIRNNVRFKTSILICFCMLSIFVFITMIINQDYVIKYLYEMFMFYLAILIVHNIDINDFILSYNKIIALFAITSVILFVFFETAYSVIHIFPSIINESGLRYYYFVFGFLENLSSSVIPRMYGIFREPGVYMIFLTLALIFEMFFTKKIKYKYIIVYISALLLTFSTAAYIVLLGIILTYLLNKTNKEENFGKRNSHNSKMWILIMIVGFLFIISIFIDSSRLYSIVFGKLLIVNSSRDSRLSSIPANFQMMLCNPLFGNGWTFVETNFQYFSSLTQLSEGGHNTNTFFKMIAIHGIGFGALVFYGTFSFWRKIGKSIIVAIMLTLIWFMALSNEDIIVNIIFYLLFFYGFYKDVKYCRTKIWLRRNF